MIRQGFLHQAIERPVSTLIGAVTLVVLGTFSLLRLPISLLPQLERPRLEISIPAEGRAREEVLDQLTRPVERRLAALAGVTSVRTWTGDGMLRARVESEWQTDADRLRIEAERLLADLDDPASASMSIELATGDAEPIVEVAVLGGASGAARTSFARKLLVPELARLDGAGRIETVGLTPLHAVVRPRAAALAARGLTPADLVERLRPMGAALPAGRAKAGSVVRPVLVREEVENLDALRAVRIKESFLGDVAQVGLEEVEDGTFFRLNGEEGVLVRVFRAPEANAVALARSVRERIGELAERTRSGPRPKVVSDRSGEVVAALKELALAALIGMALGAAVLRVLLGRWRPTLAMMVVVPASLLTSFAGFHLAGASLDVVSLAGLALAAGMLVDSAIVVLESIETARAAGAPEPAITGTREIALPVIASFLTSAVVFLPLIYLQGLARAFFGVQAFAIVVSQAASLLFSLTLTPVMSGNAPVSKDVGRSPGRRAYLGLLDAALAHPRLTVLAGIATTLVAVLALAVLPSELVPDAASKELMVRYRLAPDLSPEAARILGERVVGHVSAGSVMAVQLPGREEETGRVILSFADAGEAARAQKDLTTALSRLPDVETWVEPRTSAFVEPIERAGRRLEIVATGSTPEHAADLAGKVRERLADTGLREVAARRNRPQPALLLTWDATRLAALGADRGLIEEQVRQGLGEQTAGRIRMDGVEPEVMVRSSDQDPDLLPVGVPQIVPLRALARLDPGMRPAVLERLDGRPAERLVFEGEARDPEALLSGLPVMLQGQALELSRAFSQLRLALALSLLLVFLTVAALYESFRLPLVIMATVPVALGGALGLLAITGQTLNVLSFLGLILLAGVVVNNAIVLVHRIHERAGRGESIADVDDAIRAAARERYRPILMTTATTIAGMLPLALLPGDGVELQRALAITVIGGMVTSTFASLVLVPVLYRRIKA
ncbi:MAG: hydrophobic/amphiphilic exporter (mainly bacteria), family [Acidobacteriota bacterium]|jgi:HAE1 family hydrophobic/amphiphilic exporter-1|nr:hydrophobic/amphiphilic exporter (mainly bacteria), family [Acidobacteriota bacterium]